MRAFSRSAHGAAGAIALTCGMGLLMRLDALVDQGNSVPHACWLMLRHFTDLTNLFAVIIFAAFAFDKRWVATPSALGGVTVAMILVGILSYWLVIGPIELSSEPAIADALLHIAGPIAVIIFWLELAPKGELTVRDPFLWIVFPLVYLDYSILRGAAESDFAYRFLNGVAVGWDRTFWTALLILLTFLDLGLAIVWADGWLPRSRSQSGVAH